MRLLESKGLLHGDMLDYGCGRGFDAEYYGMDGYDPYYAPEFPQKSYDVITCNFVLNVVNRRGREKIIALVALLLKEEGVAYFTVRRDIKTEGCTSRGTEQWDVVLDYEVIEENRDFCIYRATKEGLCAMYEQE